MPRLFSCLMLAAIVAVLSFISCPTGAFNGQSNITTNSIGNYAIMPVFSRDKPVASVLIIKNKEVIYKTIYGGDDYQSISFQINSMSKQFTVAAILMLEEEGSLSTEDRISKYIDVPEKLKQAKIKHLIFHTSGVPDYLNDKSFDFDVFEKNAQSFGPEDLMSYVRNRPVKPGSYSYSNSGYFLLAKIIESASDMTYGDFLSLKVFNKLKMDTAFVNRPNQGNKKSCLVGHTVWPFFQLKDRDGVFGVYGDAGICVSIDDYAKWIIALESGEVFSKKETGEKFFSYARYDNGSLIPIPGGRSHFCGYGWKHGVVRGNKLMWHAGRVRGSSSISAKLVDKDTWFIIMSNSDFDDPLAIMADLIDNFISFDSISKKTESHE